MGICTTCQHGALLHERNSPCMKADCKCRQFSRRKRTPKINKPPEERSIIKERKLRKQLESRGQIRMFAEKERAQGE